MRTRTGKATSLINSSVQMRFLDAAFGHPRGIAGRLGGAVMARGNRRQERRAVEDAELRGGSRVLVVGPGPGVGLAQAVRHVNPGGHVRGVEPSATMRLMAIRRCARALAAGALEINDGTAERTGCPEQSMDVVISVNNVMLWDQPAGFAELYRVLRPGGRLVLTVHRHVLAQTGHDVRAGATAAGFVDATLRCSQ